MRPQLHLPLRDVPGVGTGLCCPDDPLDLVFRLFPAHAADQASLAALGIGASPPRHQGQGQKQPAESSAGGGASGAEWDSCGLSSCFLDDFEAVDVDAFFADDEPDGGGGGEAVGVQPKHVAAGAVHARGSLGGVVSNGTPPSPAPMSAGALQENACRAFEGGFKNDSPPVPMSAGALQENPRCAFDGGFKNGAPPALAPMPAGSHHGCGGALPVVVTNSTPLSPASMPASWLQSCSALTGIVSNGAPSMPAGALRPHGASSRVYPGNAPVHAALSAAAPSPSTAFCTSVGSDCLSSPTSSSPTSSSPTSSESEFSAPALQPRARVVPTKRRRPPPNCRKRSWQLDFPLDAMLAAPPIDTGDVEGNDDTKNRNSRDLADAGDGGVRRRRRPVSRQRNRQDQRVCSHCRSPDTPQWRAGPNGPGTLCNACGLRYAANKLLPEYRPTTSPDFRSDQHSNRHRNVVKLREQKVKRERKVEERSSEAMEDTEEEDGYMGVSVHVHTYQQDSDTPSI